MYVCIQHVYVGLYGYTHAHVYININIHKVIYILMNYSELYFYVHFNISRHIIQQQIVCIIDGQQRPEGLVVCGVWPVAAPL